jgi:hypothetical protein
MDPRRQLMIEYRLWWAGEALVRTFAQLAEAGRNAAHAMAEVSAVFNTPEWRRWIMKERRRERYQRRYARGPR